MTMYVLCLFFVGQQLIKWSGRRGRVPGWSELPAAGGGVLAARAQPRHRVPRQTRLTEESQPRG